MDYIQYLQFICQQMGLRLDTAYTQALDTELEFIKAQTYDVEYPAMKARMLFPVSNDVPAGAETIAYKQWDRFGMAEIIANYADDLPMVNRLAQKFTSPVHSIGIGYEYTIQDLERAAMLGERLDAEDAIAAREATEMRIESIAAIGDPQGKLKGALNNANIPVLTALNDGSATEWVQGRAIPKTAANIQADLHKCVYTIRANTLETWAPDTIVMSTTEFGHIVQTPVGTDNQTTILKSFLNNNPFITDMDSWYKLDSADAAGTGPRLMCYPRNPRFISLEIPKEFEQLPPQAKNLAFVVPTTARVGGCLIKYPLAAVYMDGI